MNKLVAMPVTLSNAFALDVGERRIGIAVANLTARLPRPYATLDNTPAVWDELHELIRTENIFLLVVGLPRGMQGQETAQTKYVMSFVEELQTKIDLPVHMQDEAVTSLQAEAELRKTRTHYSKGEIDSLAATYILEDFLMTYKGDEHEQL